MTPTEFKAIRQSLGLSAAQLARLVGVESGRTVRRWEAGDSAIPGPVRVLLTAITASDAVRQHFGLAAPPAAMARHTHVSGSR